jgi:DNA invertase Pin-like site-specific DNA recombinase
MEKVVIYSRVSTKDQNCENQIQLLKKIVDQNNWGLIDTCVDVGISV